MAVTIGEGEIKDQQLLHTWEPVQDLAMQLAAALLSRPCTVHFRLQGNLGNCVCSSTVDPSLQPQAQSTWGHTFHELFDDADWQCSCCSGCSA